ncbi:hypothetical protein AVEN_26713-1 [Araneus ventricosus]|uniref:Uncharacterized protein n=1 Tax=Araneus ventricosus TaxID=182803 RepID=A0A4Y2T683_ARAVE|nr:hypothetical protein AVEN_26713-1 [Araneus ventricosus]
MEETSKEWRLWVQYPGSPYLGSIDGRYFSISTRYSYDIFTMLYGIHNIIVKSWRYSVQNILVGVIRIRKILFISLYDERQQHESSAPNDVERTKTRPQCQNTMRIDTLWSRWLDFHPVSFSILRTRQ